MNTGESYSRKERITKRKNRNNEKTERQSISILCILVFLVSSK